ncbi:uncharacterized protein LOC130614282 [Hydractinia symbiolongicarpus]|uniref:uncharacterized protein LOC130614282 n=1 Tax=Hydractinia symbiolongicarpus TaxID=13093 RepID=UPI00255107AE|nr:uncharacterized protein LOC130614282 [Hydractinia symbiolongicarpus]
MDKVLSHVVWSSEKASLKEFTSKHELPQIVKVEHRDNDALDKKYFSVGQTLKLHCIQNIRKIECRDDRGVLYFIPVCLQEKVFQENKGDAVSSIAELATFHPAAQYVQVLNGYCIDGNGKGIIIDIEQGELLEIVNDIYEKISDETFLTFRNASGEEFDLPNTCNAGFMPLFNVKETVLKEILPTGFDERFKHFSFQFARKEFSYRTVGSLHCQRIYDEKVIIASAVVECCSYVFAIPQDLQLVIKIAEGSIHENQTYDNIRVNFHKSPGLETEVSQRLINHIFHSPNEIYKFEHVFFEDGSNDYEVPVPVRRATISKPFIQPKPNRKKKPSFSKPRNEIIKNDEKKSIEGEVPVLEARYCTPQKKIVKYDEKKCTQSEVPVLQAIYCTPQKEILKNDQKKSIQSEAPVLEARYSTPQKEMVKNDQKKGIRSKAPVLQARYCTPPQPPYISLQKDTPHTDKTMSKKVDKMSVLEICDVLRSLNLGKHIENFKSNQIDGALLCELETSELKDVGLSGFEIKKIFRYRAGWRPKTV